MISYIKGINAIENIDDLDIEIDDKFYKENSKEINEKIKSIDISFKINFVNKHIPYKIFEFDKDIISKVKNNNKVIIEQNRTEDLNTEKSYRRKIKKKIIEN